MTIVVALLIAVIGLIMYLFLAHQKLANIGMVMFACGLLAFLLQSGVALRWVGIGVGR